MRMCVRRIRSPLKHDQVMLAGRLAPLDGPAGDRRVDVDAIEMRVRGFELRDDMSGQHAVHRPRGAKDRVALRHRRRRPHRPQLQAHRGRGEAGLEQVAGWRDARAAGSPLMSSINQPRRPFGRALRDRDELAREGAADLRALRFIVRQRDDQLAIAAADPRRQAAVDDHHARAGRARGLPARDVALAGHVESNGPRQQHAIRIRRIGGRQRDRDDLVALLARVAQQIDRAGLRELRRAEAGDEVAAANAAGFLEPPQHRIHGGESAGQLLDRRRHRA